MKSNSNRRQFLAVGAGAAGAFILASPITKALAASCGLTPPQTAGPFYPGEKLFHQDNDLTQISGAIARALGQVIYMRGKVLDANCNPVAGANVEVWQACESGRYNNPNDPNTAPMDPHFKYWGETYTDKNGEYIFKSIRPGAYPADTNWMRPSHVHFKVNCLGYHELVAQMYFKGDPYNDTDLILQAVPAAQRSSVIVDFQASPIEFEPGSLSGNFDIILTSVR